MGMSGPPIELTSGWPAWILDSLARQYDLLREWRSGQFLWAVPVVVLTNGRPAWSPWWPPVCWPGTWAVWGGPGWISSPGHGGSGSADAWCPCQGSGVERGKTDSFMLCLHQGCHHRVYASTSCCNNLLDVVLIVSVRDLTSRLLKCVMRNKVGKALSEGIADGLPASSLCVWARKSLNEQD